MKTAFVIYYSKDGKTKRMADYICEGMNELEVKVAAKKVEEFRVVDLVLPDSLVIGSPTYFSNMSWQTKKLVDESIIFYGSKQSLEGKIGGCFTAAGCSADGLECLKALELSFGYHHKMNLVSGIVSDEDEEEEKLKQVCIDFGRKIAQKLTGQ